MRILHTADWHLGRRQGRIDRSDDLRRAIGRIMAYCESEGVEVLIIAGDLFEVRVPRPDEVCRAVDLLRGSIQPFLRRGGTVLAIAGNHDGETLSQTIGHALGLVDPPDLSPGSRLANGRFHLFPEESFHRLIDRSGVEVQFALMPYPRPSRYFDDAVASHQGGVEGKNRRLREDFTGRLARMRSHRAFDPGLHSILVGHLFLQGATLPGGRVISADDEKQDVVCPPEALGSGWAYVALGHVHKPQALGGLGHVRYSGSIERLAFDEREDRKEVVLLEVGPGGLEGRPRSLPLESSPFLDVEVRDPSAEIPTLRARHPDADRALVRCRVGYEAGVHDPEEIRREIGRIFPRWYDLDIVEAGRARSRAMPGPVERRGLRETVMDHLRGQLEGQEIAEAVCAEAGRLIEEVGR